MHIYWYKIKNKYLVSSFMLKNGIRRELNPAIDAIRIEF